MSWRLSRKRAASAAILSRRGRGLLIRIGIAGAGGMAAQRCREFNASGTARVDGIYSTSRQKTALLAESSSARAFDDFHRMLPEVDAVVLCTPNAVHGSLARASLEAGKHVLVEYPLCADTGEAETLRALARECRRVLMTGNTIIHEAMFRYLVERRELLGDVLSASSRVALYDKALAGRWYMNRKELGSVFAGFHYHHIEYYRRLLGEVQWVLARDESRLDVAGGTLVMGHLSGATSCVQWYLSRSGSGLPRGLWMNGTRSSVTIISREPGRSLAVWNDGGKGREETIEDDWGVRGSCRDFIDAIEGRLDHEARLAADMETLRVGLLAEEAARSGGVLATRQSFAPPNASLP